MYRILKNLKHLENCWLSLAVSIFMVSEAQEKTLPEHRLWPQVLLPFPFFSLCCFSLCWCQILQFIASQLDNSFNHSTMLGKSYCAWRRLAAYSHTNWNWKLWEYNIICFFAFRLNFQQSDILQNPCTRSSRSISHDRLSQVFLTEPCFLSWHVSLGRNCLETGGVGRPKNPNDGWGPSSMGAQGLHTWRWSPWFSFPIQIIQSIGLMLKAQPSMFSGLSISPACQFDILLRQ